MPMIKKAIILTLIALFLAGPLSPSTASALSCERTYPRIATIESIEINQDNSIDLSLKWVFSFDVNRISSASIIKIDDYLEIVDRYLADEIDDLIDLEKEGVDWQFDQLKIDREFATRMDVNSSDIIVTAPPIHVCKDSFLAVFDERGVLKHAQMKGDFDDYSFAGENLITEIGKQIECEGYSCKVKTDFSINERKFSLVPSQDLEVKDSAFKKIFLNESRAPEKGSDSASIFPWGGGRQLEYLLDFSPIEENELPEEDLVDENDEDVKQEQEKQFEDGNTDDQVVEGPKPDNIFKRFFSWLKSLFAK
jgi:hypothetical protein